MCGSWWITSSGSSVTIDYVNQFFNNYSHLSTKCRYSNGRQQTQQQVLTKGTLSAINSDRAGRTLNTLLVHCVFQKPTINSFSSNVSRNLCSFEKHIRFFYWILLWNQRFNEKTHKLVVFSICFWSDQKITSSSNQKNSTLF